ncbi:hypothetical protein BHU72_01680 [Desulfuribacillus stibiiarsenatis]|uniref:Reverse transcriptase domain-containing protein n=1 Tax=Desulfuribacillus stibiiarsenatis TaxID=1390249 RepID=A0A1E5LA48_9FIRM|nr:RNA-directed DNA polymerase [Desulfuribacillus stibiiarsenatis]OEH86992.1 hypothetical protein BHU72_01680 [Desulfuribacillus stibiiarsenatis]
MAYNLDDITKEFMFKGLFSEYLPSNYNLDSKNINIFEDVEISQSSDFIDPYKYSMSRFIDNEKRRVIYLPELTAYLSVVKYMKENNIIKELVDFSISGNSSFSKLVQANGKLSKHEISYFGDYIEDVEMDDELFVSTYIPNVVEKINRAKGAKGILYLDISNHYASIYTHILPSILLGYDEAITQFKIFLSNNQDERVTSDYKKYKDLDEKVRALNAGRTNGLLTGTLISQFIAEALLTRIDKEIEKRNINFVRYADDYEVFIYDENEIEKISTEISDTIAKYHFTFNNEKSRYIQFPYYAVKNLEKIYNRYLQSNVDSPEIIELFNTYFSLEKEGTKGAVRYLIKSIDQRIKIKDKQLYTSFLLNVLVNDNRSLIKVCELIVREKENLCFKDDHIEIIKNLLNQYIVTKKELEVIWLLYLLKNLGVNALDEDTMMKVIHSNNELALVMIIDEYKLNINDEIKKVLIQSAKSWILLYQLFLREYITKEEFKVKSGIKKNIAFYSRLKHKQFTHYKSINMANK